MLPTNGFAVHIVEWFSLWCLVWGGFLVLVHAGINYLSSPCLTSIYFFSAAFSSVMLFRNLFATRVLRALWNWRLALPLLTLCFGIAVYTLNKLPLPIPESPLSKQPDMFFLSSSPWYLIPKTFDILFQQVLMFCLTLLLARNG